MSAAARGWDEIVEHALVELAAGEPRAEAYWAQQLAFGPVFLHALRLRARRAGLSAAERRAVLPALGLALAALGRLPDPPWPDAAAARLLAVRQVRALGWNRRRLLRRAIVDLGSAPPDSQATAPSRMLRAYPLLGFRPDQELRG